MDVAIGVDTSCYTTSAAALDLGGRLVADARIPLVVKAGGRGLAQSEMVFQHVRNLPVVMEQLRRSIADNFRIVAVGASIKPRPLEDSYMPVFLVGQGLARSLSVALGCPFFPTSHQENHLWAGLWSAGLEPAADFLAVHASGGTTEILKVSTGEEGLAVELIGGSRDLNAGQFIDRVGVALGLAFPAGAALEKLAAQSDGGFSSIPVAVQGMQISFSGPETHVMRLLASQPEPSAVAAAAQRCVAESLLSALIAASRTTGLNRVLLVGGVGANRSIRETIAEGLRRAVQAEVFWPSPEFSGDNATGAAWWALRQKAV